MNITYLIGNGFDIGLGLKTGYRSFLDWYVGQPNESPAVEWLKNQVLRDKEQWSDAELELLVECIERRTGRIGAMYPRQISGRSSPNVRLDALQPEVEVVAYENCQIAKIDGECERLEFPTLINTEI